MRGDENATNEWKAPEEGGALWVIKKSFSYFHTSVRQYPSKILNNKLLINYKVS